MFNQAILVGYLGHDPELRHSSGGRAVTTFSLATSESWVKDGERVTQTEWHRLVAWGKLAEICCQWLRKGSLILVRGQITYRNWEKDGQKRTSTEVVIQEMKMIGPAPKDEPPEDVPF
ncbi:MAG: single-stranded DNA-binding protein [Thermodesulfobacteriota bacterium]